MWRVTADNGQCHCEGYRRGLFAPLGFDFGRGCGCFGARQSHRVSSSRVVPRLRW